ARAPAPGRRLIDLDTVPEALARVRRDGEPRRPTSEANRDLRLERFRLQRSTHCRRSRRIRHFVQLYAVRRAVEPHDARRRSELAWVPCERVDDVARGRTECRAAVAPREPDIHSHSRSAVVCFRGVNSGKRDTDVVGSDERTIVLSTYDADADDILARHAEGKLFS